MHMPPCRRLWGLAPHEYRHSPLQSVSAADRLSSLPGRSIYPRLDSTGTHSRPQATGLPYRPVRGLPVVFSSVPSSHAPTLTQSFVRGVIVEVDRSRFFLPALTSFSDPPRLASQIRRERRCHAPSVLVLPTMLSILLHFPAQISAHDLAEGMLVCFESAELLPGWHVGTVGLTKDGCVMIRKSAPEPTHGRIGFNPTCIQKLERQDGEKWVEVPLTPIAHSEPKQCQEPTG